MLEKRFNLQIITPERVLFEDEVEGVQAPGAAGSFEILTGHIPFLSLLEAGPVGVSESGTRRMLATSGGMIEVLRTGATLLLETAEWADEIDVSRAEQARERARQRLAERADDLDVDRAELALLRAINRLRVAGRS